MLLFSYIPKQSILRNVYQKPLWKDYMAFKESADWLVHPSLLLLCLWQPLSVKTWPFAAAIAVCRLANAPVVRLTWGVIRLIVLGCVLYRLQSDMPGVCTGGEPHFLAVRNAARSIRSSATDGRRVIKTCFRLDWDIIAGLTKLCRARCTFTEGWKCSRCFSAKIIKGWIFFYLKNNNVKAESTKS